MHRSRPEAQAEHVELEPRTRTDRAADGEEEDGMSDTPWTPGPWDQIGKEMVQREYVVWRSNYNDATDTRVIATGIESEADARLIAAAPEMAEILFYFVASADDEAVSDLAQATYENCVEQSRALLARIRGEA
jgi:hypothetical protein